MLLLVLVLFFTGAAPEATLLGGSVGLALGDGGGVLVESVAPRAPAKSDDWLLANVETFRSHTWSRFNASRDRVLSAPSPPRVYKLSRLVTGALARRLIVACEETASERGGWTTTRHHRHPTQDLPVSLLLATSTSESIYDLVAKTVLPAVAALYGRPPEVLSIDDLFVVKYSYSANGGQNFSSLESHVDGSAFSFNALLSAPGDFDGGGTTFSHLGMSEAFLKEGGARRQESASGSGSERINVTAGTTLHLPLRGDALVHRGDLRHAGALITRGERFALVGFIRERPLPEPGAAT